MLFVRSSGTAGLSTRDGMTRIMKRERSLVCVTSMAEAVHVDECVKVDSLAFLLFPSMKAEEYDQRTRINYSSLKS